LKILDTSLCRSVSKKIKLLAGDKINGSLEVTETRYKTKYSIYDTLYDIPSLRLVIYRLGEKHWWGKWKKVVYETPDIVNQLHRHWNILFEVLEDGEYQIEIKEHLCCFKVQLYLERRETVVY